MSDTDTPTVAAPPPSSRSRLLVRLAALAGLVLLAPVGLNAFGEWQRAGATADAVTAHRARAGAALAEGRFDAATVALEAAHVLAPGDPATQRQAMVLAVTRAAQQPSQVGDGSLAALEYALATLAAGPGEVPDSTRLVAKGVLAERRGDAVVALARFHDAVKAAPADVFAHLAVARLQRRAGRRVEALAAFEAAVVAAPKNVEARNNLGVLYADLGRPDDAVTAFQAAIDAEDNVASRMNLAMTLAGAERVAEGIQHLRRAVELAPTSAIAYRQLGQLLTLGGKHDEAERALLTSLNLAKDVTTGLALARLYQVQGRHDQAAEVLTAALKARKDNFEAAYLLGVSLRALGRTHEAVAAFSMYLEYAERAPGEAERVAEVRALLAPAPAPAAAAAPDGTPDAP